MYLRLVFWTLAMAYISFLFARFDIGTLPPSSGVMLTASCSRHHSSERYQAWPSRACSPTGLSGKHCCVIKPRVPRKTRAAADHASAVSPT